MGPIFTGHHSRCPLNILLQEVAVVLPGDLGLEWDELPDCLELECGRWNGVEEWHEWNGKEWNDRANTEGWECCVYRLVLSL